MKKIGLLCFLSTLCMLLGAADQGEKVSKKRKDAEIEMPVLEKQLFKAIENQELKKIQSIVEKLKLLNRTKPTYLENLVSEEYKISPLAYAIYRQVNNDIVDYLIEQRAFNEETIKSLERAMHHKNIALIRKIQERLEQERLEIENGACAWLLHASLGDS